MNKFIRTNSGVAFPVKPDFRFVNLRDIAKGLATAARWGGQCNGRYPVLAHAIHVSMLVPPEHRYQALHHDDSEAYLCDIAAPFKALLPDYKKVEHALMKQIGKALDFTWPPHPAVKKADAAVLYLERCALFDTPPGDDVEPVLADIHVAWDFNYWSNLSIRELELHYLHYHRLYLND